MRMNPSIPMAGANPNFLQTIGDATRAAGMANAVQDQNALRGLYREQGPGIMAGEQGAMNALARLDPAQAAQFQQNREQSQMARERLSMARQAAARAAETHVAQMDAVTRQKEAEDLDRTLSRLAMANDPQSWDAFAQEVMPEAVGKFGERDMILAQGLGLKDVLAMQKGPEPQSPEGKFYADQRAGLIPEGVAQGDTEADRELSRLQSIGIPRDVAIKIKEGVFKVVTDPTTRESVVIDLSDGSPVYRVSMDGQQPQATPDNPARPQGGEQPPDQRLTFGGEVSDASDAFGAEGIIKKGANWVGDVTNMGVPFEGVQETQSDFAVLREAMINDVASAYNRQPPSWLLKNIEALTPEAGSLSQGASGAQSKLRALRRNFESELALARKQAARRMSPGQREENEAKRIGLENAIGRVDGALSRFGGSKEGNTTSSGVKWRVVE